MRSENANLVRADFMQAEIKDAHLEGANLKMAEGLTSEQLAEAHTDEKPFYPPSRRAIRHEANVK